MAKVPTGGELRTKVTQNKTIININEMKSSGEERWILKGGNGRKFIVQICRDATTVVVKTEMSRKGEVSYESLGHNTF